MAGPCALEFKLDRLKSRDPVHVNSKCMDTAIVPTAQLNAALLFEARQKLFLLSILCTLQHDELLIEPSKLALSLDLSHPQSLRVAPEGKT